jgi:hypothetical protein
MNPLVAKCPEEKRYFDQQQKLEEARRATRNEESTVYTGEAISMRQKQIF